MPLRPYEFLSVHRLCAPVDNPAALGFDRNTVYTALKGATITHRPPRYVLPDDDLMAPGQVSVEPINLRAHAIRSEDTFLAALTDVVVEKFSRRPALNNTFTLFVDEGVALAEAFHNRTCGDNIARLLGETVPVDVDGGVHVKLYEAEEPERVVEEPCILMASRFVHHNYYHWTFEGLTRLWALGALGALPDAGGIPLVFPSPDLRPFHIDTLRAMGVRNPIYPLNHRLTRFRRLYVPSFLDGATVTPRQVAWLRDTLFRTFPQSRPGSDVGGPRRICVSRRDANARRVANEDEVMALLAPHGFELVVPGTLPVAEQIRLFANAEIVVAPHGAGNSNVAFCPPGALFLELVPASNACALYWMLANVSDLRYGRMVCPEDQPGLSMTVDPARLGRLLSAALEDRA
jgi:capsular polysaccharide biosynthesis protein